ncbi:FecR family protein [Mucilaginibacter conchicola]|uniref:FecR family protein n=1 Tax=Mucilaginibacter conchicola TaxID=2303333 RepID=UPI001314D8C3|nr:FecR domain-containing protein [Mucilaginibacter conchicola]
MELNKKEKELIRKLINGTASKAELEEVQEIMNTPQGRQGFDEVMDETGGEFKADPQAETDGSVDDKLKLFKQRNNIEPVVPVIRISLWRSIARYAAILVLIAGAGFYFIGNRNNKAQQQMASSATSVKLIDYKTARGQRATLSLSDGSTITLGPDSKLSYPESFAGNRRDVYLQGEAFFEVAKDPQKPFTVHSYELETRVVGTSFKIDAFKNDPLEVSVVTGKVRVSSLVNGQKKQLATMLPGDHISWFKGQPTTDKRDILETLAWANNKLIFNNQELSRILAALERAYNVTIDSKKLSGANEKISVTLNGRWPLNRTMNVLAATAGFQYKIEGQKVTVFSK